MWAISHVSHQSAAPFLNSGGIPRNREEKEEGLLLLVRSGPSDPHARAAPRHIMRQLSPRRQYATQGVRRGICRTRWYATKLERGPCARPLHGHHRLSTPACRVAILGAWACRASSLSRDLSRRGKTKRKEDALGEQQENKNSGSGWRMRERLVGSCAPIITFWPPCA